MSGRIRSLKPEWLEDEALLRCSSDARVTSAALLLLADDHGNGRGSDLYLGSQIFPGEPLAKIREALASLSRIRYVGFYEIDGQRYFTIRNWAKHQKVDHPGKPRVPEPLPGFRESLAKVHDDLATSSRLIPIPIPIGTTTTISDHDHLPSELLEKAHAEFESREKLGAPSAPPSGRRKREHSPEAKAKAKAIRDAYVSGYQALYGKAPPWGKREWGQVYNLLGSWTADDILGLLAPSAIEGRPVGYFFAWKRPEVIRAGHSWGTGKDCFVLKIAELQADVLAPQRRALAAAAQDRERAENHTAGLQDQAARVAAKMGQHGKEQGDSANSDTGRVERPHETGGVDPRNVSAPALGRVPGDVGRDPGASLRQNALRSIAGRVLEDPEDADIG